MDRAQLELVVAVDETGSLTDAARQLRTAQPAVSRRLASLERQLGVELFDRGRQGAQPTPAGRAVVQAARDALGALERADRAAARAAEGSAGILRIGTTPTLGADLLPAVLAEHRRAHPDVHLELVASGDSTWLQRELAEGRIDVALTALTAAPPSGVEVAAAAPQEFVLVLAADDPLAAEAEALPRARLVGQPMVALRHGEGLRQLVDTFFAGLGAEPVVTIETTEREMLLPLVAAGLGATIVPATFALQRAGSGVVARALDPPLTRPVGVLVRAPDDEPQARAFAERAGRAMAQSTPDDATITPVR